MQSLTFTILGVKVSFGIGSSIAPVPGRSKVKKVSPFGTTRDVLCALLRETTEEFEHLQAKFPTVLPETSIRHCEWRIGHGNIADIRRTVASGKRGSGRRGGGWRDREFYKTGPPAVQRCNYYELIGPFLNNVWLS